jgi:steroid delta-isomerase-like uncharacterized protein
LSWTDALNRHDADGVAASFAEDGVMTDTGTGQRAEGRTAIKEAAAGFISMFTDLRIDKTATMSDGDRYGAEWVMTGIHTGDIPGLPATGRSFRVVGAGMGEVRDGLIVRATEYWNMADFLTQVGHPPS